MLHNNLCGWFNIAGGFFRVLLPDQSAFVGKIFLDFFQVHLQIAFGQTSVGHAGRFVNELQRRRSLLECNNGNRLHNSCVQENYEATLRRSIRRTESSNSQLFLTTTCWLTFFEMLLYCFLLPLESCSFSPPANQVAYQWVELSSQTGSLVAMVNHDSAIRSACWGVNSVADWLQS